MKTRLLIFALLLSLSMVTSAWARLGETEGVVIGRYGKPIIKMHRAWGDEETFSVNGFSIVATFINGVSVGESYSTPGHSITDVQVSDLLSANCQGFSWEEPPKNQIPKDIFHPVKQMWTRPNGSTAVLTGSTFEVKSIYLILAQEDAAKQKPAAPSTQGF